jgi:hypothetical protein
MSNLLLVLTLMAAGGVAADPPRSGLPVGAKVPAIEIADPERTATEGSPCCRIDLGEGAGLLAFVVPGPEAVALVERVDAEARRYRDAAPPLSVVVVFLGGPEVRPELERLLKEREWEVPIYYLPTGKPPAPFKINARAASTVMVVRGRRVLANFVDVNPGAFQPVAEAVAAAAKRGAGVPPGDR